MLPSVVGEAARRPVGNLYKLDGRMSTAYAGKKDRDKEERIRQEVGGAREGAAQGQATGVAGQLHKNVIVSRSDLIYESQ